MVVTGSLWWSVVVSGGYWWSVMVCGGRLKGSKWTFVCIR